MDKETYQHINIALFKNYIVIKSYHADIIFLFSNVSWFSLSILTAGNVNNVKQNWRLLGGTCDRLCTPFYLHSALPSH